MYVVYGFSDSRLFRVEPCETYQEACNIAARMERELLCVTEIKYKGATFDVHSLDFEGQLEDRLAYERVKEHERGT